MKSKHIVDYTGMGVWKDAEGKGWGAKAGEILPTREFESETDQDGFLASRPDIKFMVDYGQMKASTISIDNESAVLDGKTAVASGVKIVGTMPNTVPPTTATIIK